MHPRTIALAASLVGSLVPLHAAVIWREGEDATKKNVQLHGWYNSVKKDVLSGGNWLSHYGNAPGEATYDIEAPASGSYTFWARLNPVASHPSWQVDGAAWKTVEFGDARGQQNIASDNKPDHRFIAWVKLGSVQLAKGRHSIAFRWEGGPSNSGGLDCFVLTTEPFVPQGTMKPGESGTESGTTQEAEADPKDAIWIEGEKPSRHAMNRHPWWYDQVKKDVLSGGDWISNFSKEKEGTADYDFDSLTADTYAFWVRANPSVGAQLLWQLDDAAWTPIDFKDARGQQNIAADNKPDMRFLAWANAGRVKLAPGKHTVRFKMAGTPENSHHGGLDCFVFTRIPFVPAGAKKPTVAKATAGGAADWFPLLADEDTFSSESVIDMSHLIPAPAGKFGFLKAAGKDLKFERAPAPVKFWGCGANLEAGRYSREQLAQRARYLRKFGINLVRQHPVFDDVTTDGRLDAKKLDAYDWWFAELKKHGIYTQWSVFYHFTIGPDDGYPADLYAELEGSDRSGRKDTYGIITISPKLWEIRTRWLIPMLQHKNPYTGLRYVDDPALALVEMHNEDSVFFYNPLSWLAEGKKMPLHSRMLRQRWCEWVKAKYRTDDAVRAAWGNFSESLASGELRIGGAWDLAGDGPRGGFGGSVKRAGDYIRFLAEMQRAFYDACEQAMRTAGLKCTSATTAWQVGGAASDAANTWTDTAAPVIDRHNYAGGGAGGYRITEGKVENASHLPTPGGGIFSVGMKQVEDAPFSISEWTQSAPNQWKLEVVPIMGFYAMGLQGWDISDHFAQSGTRLTDGWGTGSSFVSDMPHFMGQFPAIAFALYNGHIAEAPVVAARRLTMDEVFSGKDPLRQDFTRGGYDVKTLVSMGGTPAEVFAIGRVTTAFKGGKSETADLTKYWDQPNKIIHSATGELTWDYGRELITVQSPKTQAVLGKAGGETLRLPGVGLAVKTPFVSLIFTPLDNLPLAQSRQILITALAQDKQTGTRYNADGTRLEAAGTAPLLLEPVQASFRLAGAKPAQVRPLDHYGVPMPGKLVPIAPDGSVTIDGTWRAYYYEVRR